MKLKLFSGIDLPGFTAPVFFGVALAATATVIFESLMPTGPSASIGDFDKIMHFVSYFTLAGLWALAFRGRSLITIVAALAVMGIGLEIAQQMMNLGRTGSIWDALANFAGCVLAAFIMNALTETKSRDAGAAQKA